MGETDASESEARIVLGKFSKGTEAVKKRIAEPTVQTTFVDYEAITIRTRLDADDKAHLASRASAEKKVQAGF